MIPQKEILNTFLALIKINGESGNEINFAKYISKELAQIGLDVHIDKANEIYHGNSGNVIAFYEGTNKNLPPIILSAHMDTIEPTTNINVIVEKNIIKTDGTTILGADDRSGIAAILEALKFIIKNDIPAPPIKVILTVAEEIGMYGSSFYEDKEPFAKYAFVFDSSADPGKIIVAAPTSKVIKIEVIGKSAHAAVHPEDGINAIKIAAMAISKIKVGRISPTCTANFGKISGGKAVNIVPDLVSIDAEVRSLNNSEIDSKINEIKTAFNEAVNTFGGNYVINIKEKYPAFNIDENSPLIKLAKNALSELELKPETIKFSGGSDANQFNAKGIPALNFGIGMKSVHSHKEYIDINHITMVANAIIKIVENYTQIEL